MKEGEVLSVRGVGGRIGRIETERAIVHGNRELIRIYEEKVKRVIEKIWEG